MIVHSDAWLTLYTGDCREVMASMEPESVQCVVTSPPYWGLRDYGVAGQLGLEASPEAYVEAMVEVFREVRRVLRKDGTVWLNLGDSYASGAGKVGDRPGGGDQGDRWAGTEARGARGQHLPKQSGKHAPRIAAMGPMTQPNRMPLIGLKPKDRVMIPARVALALQADGWWLRDEIVWHKPNPMPSSVEDRTTPAHEMVYLLTKSARYHYDAAAIRERASGPDNENNRFGARLDVGLPDGKSPDRRRNGARVKVPGGWDVTSGEGGHGSVHRQGRTAATYRESSQIGAVSESTERQVVGLNARWNDSVLAGTAPAGRNRRSVWTVATEPYLEAHFATFPTALIEPMILAGCPAGGVVLDPFGGSGTVGLVAERLGRRSILIDLSPDYCRQAMERIGRGRGRGDGPALDLPVQPPPGSLWSA